MATPTITRYNLAAQILVSLYINNEKHTAKQLAAQALEGADAFKALINAEKADK